MGSAWQSVSEPDRADSDSDSGPGSDNDSDCSEGLTEDHHCVYEIEDIMQRTVSCEPEGQPSFATVISAEPQLLGDGPTSL